VIGDLEGLSVVGDLLLVGEKEINGFGVGLAVLGEVEGLSVVGAIVGFIVGCLVDGAIVGL